MAVVDEHISISTEQLELITNCAKDFAETQIRPHFMEWDETQFFPVDLMHKLGELGFLGVFIPEDRVWNITRIQILFKKLQKFVAQLV